MIFFFKNKVQIRIPLEILGFISLTGLTKQTENRGSKKVQKQEMVTHSS